MQHRDRLIELRDVCHIALEEYFSSIRGANAFRDVAITESGPGSFRIKYKTDTGAQEYLHLTVCAQSAMEIQQHEQKKE